ncbi:bifunctional DNA primase/polymerase [Streptomyces mirabilis]|nr:bifunctional DNA primase/polymerase [Streptomyces mirabilis]
MLEAGATLDEVSETWGEFPGAAVMLPVGRAFDVIEVAEAAGRRALVRLERMGLPTGRSPRPRTAAPTSSSPPAPRPSSRVALPDGLGRRLLDLHGLGPGTYVTAPPSDRAGLGPVRWLRSPALDSATKPPQARLLLGTLAYVAHRSRA